MTDTSGGPSGAYPVHVGFRRRVEFQFVKPDGSPGNIDGPPTVSSDEPDRFNTVMDGDGAFFVDCIAAGPANVTLQADADLGAGVKMVEKVYAFEGIDWAVDHVTETVGDEEPIPGFDGSAHTGPVVTGDTGGDTTGGDTGTPAADTAGNATTGTATPGGPGDAGSQVAQSPAGTT